MHAYAVVNANNLYHAVLRELIVMNDKLAEHQDIYTLPVDQLSTETLDNDLQNNEQENNRNCC